MSNAPKTFKPRIMQLVITSRLIANLPTGTIATVTATGSGRFQIEPLGFSQRYWTESDALAPIAPAGALSQK